MVSVTYAGPNVDPAVTVRCPEGPLKVALDSLFEQTGTEYTAECDLSTLRIPETVISETPFSRALTLLLTQCNCTYRQEGGRYVISQVQTVQPAVSPKSVGRQRRSEPSDVVPGMSRYEVKQILGDRYQLIPGVVAGCEIWDYGHVKVEFRRLHVAEVSAPITRVTFRPSSAPPPGLGVPTSHISMPSSRALIAPLGPWNPGRTRDRARSLSNKSWDMLHPPTIYPCYTTTIYLQQ
jgi:hypothetical protein